MRPVPAFRSALTTAVALMLLLPSISIGVAAADPFAYAWQEMAPGVWAGIRSDPFELPQEGNVVFVVTDPGVLLFDAGGSPAMGEAIVAKVRATTDRPITHVVLSHWHGDHMRGLQAIVTAFPEARILAHPHARDRILETRDRWLKRRVTMVTNIRAAVGAALGKDQDLAGRPLIAEEKAWLERGLAATDRLDWENRRTDYVVPAATFDGALRLHAGGREVDFLWLGAAHTAGDLVMWLPQERIVATGDIVTAPIPLMPSPHARDYPATLAAIKALGYTALVPGHGAVERDAAYVDLLSVTIATMVAQMKSLADRGVAREAAVAQADYSAVEDRFTHGDPFLAHRFEDYVRAPLADGAYLAAIGKPPDEAF